MADANDGLLVLRPAPIEPRRTIIVTGLARSGTSMVAAMLDAAQLHLGTEVDRVVREDLEIARVLGHDRLAEIVADRNARHPVWGFKRPNLHAFGPEMVAAFRSPRLIVTCRDPVAVGRRSMLSERYPDMAAAAEAEAAAREGLAMLSFAIALPCPVLLISYEKALEDPARLAQAILGFTGLRADPPTIAQAVHPGRPDYLVHARRQFHGHIDWIVDDVVHGWAAEPDSPSPLILELLIDGVPYESFPADEFRLDLAQQGIGTGHHAFSRVLPPRTRRMAKVTVRVAGRTHELVGSGRPLKSWTRRL